MDFWRFLMYAMVGLSGALLGEAVWRRQSGLIVDRLLSLGFVVCLTLGMYPPPPLHGARPLLTWLALALVTAQVAPALWRRLSRPGPPAA